MRDVSRPAEPARIGIVGGGWRADYYLRVAQQIPEAFTVGAVLVRSESTAERIRVKWHAHTTTDIATFLRNGPYDYAVVAVPAERVSEYMLAFAAADIPVLTETPPAKDLGALNTLYRAIGQARVQVAEQYQFQAHHAARMAVAESGVLGKVHTAYISAAHEYHAMALLRQGLRVGFQPVTVTARTIRDVVQSPRGRDGWKGEITEAEISRMFAWLEFEGGALGNYDFEGDQYVSPIRSRTVKLSGPRGELINDVGSYIVEVGRAASIRLQREMTGQDGDLEGFFLRRIVDGSTVLWENEYPGARLNDDELAVARVMGRMADYVQTGFPFYSLADGSHDHYLGLLIGESARSGLPVESEPQAWSGATSVFDS